MPNAVVGATHGITGHPLAFSVEDGRVRYGRPPEGDVLDLTGKWVLPALVDAHCHILPAGLDLQKLNLDRLTSREDVLDSVRDWAHNLPEGKWALAVHYDQNRFADGFHLTRRDLDAISSERPILLRHVSGHASVGNTVAFREAGIDLGAADLPGGSFGRDADGLINGLALEDAHEWLSKGVPNPDLSEMVDAILRAGHLMAGRGILSASDMMTGRFDLALELEAYRLAALRGCPVRTRLYVLWGEVFGGRGLGSAALREYDASCDSNTCRIGGIKIFADGAIGSATAAIYGQYSGAPPTGPVLSRRARNAVASAPEGVAVSGQLIYAPERLREMVRIAAEQDFQVSIHTIGDYATDLVMEAYESAQNPSRHRIEHAMLLSDAQIDRMSRLGCFCTMQPEFLLRFGRTYQRQLGPQRGALVERMRSVWDAGIPLSLSSDMPITTGDPWSAMAAAVRRPEGFDPDEGLTVEEALVGYSTAGAEANLDDEFGALQDGQLADFLVFEEDPRSLKAAPISVYSRGEMLRQTRPIA